VLVLIIIWIIGCYAILWFVAKKLGALNMDPKFLDPKVNEGLSGREKKQNEILQLLVKSNVFINNLLFDIVSNVEVKELES